MKQVPALLALAVLAAGCSQAHAQKPTSQPTGAPYPTPAPGDVVPHPPFPTNANGMTYGSGINERDPELIAAYGTQGEFGYVLATDLEQPIPPGLHTGVGRPHSMALYAKDGITIIGVYRRQRGGSGPTPTD
jgi:hypothetical protein